MGKVDLRTKGVAFNVADQQQRELFNHAMSKSNFSGYVKGLIVRDMLGMPAVENEREQGQKPSDMYANVSTFL